MPRPRQFVVRMDLNGKIAPRINELDEQGEHRPKLLVNARADKFRTILANQGGERQANIAIG